MIKVLFAHAMPLNYLGGAELSLSHYLKNKPANVEVDVIQPDERRELDNYHAIVLGNLRPMGGVGEKAECGWADEWTEKLEQYRGRKIRAERDMHPCGHRSGECVMVGTFVKRPCQCCLIPQTFERLFNACDAIVYVSPAQRKMIDAIITVSTPGFLIAPPVDFRQFRNFKSSIRLEKYALAIGDSLRVSDEAERLASSHGYKLIRLKSGSVTHEKMPEVFNRYSAVVIAPRIFHACSRVAIEAMACGCKVLTNGLCGASSWTDPVAASMTSNSEFWDVVLPRNVDV